MVSHDTLVLPNSSDIELPASYLDDVRKAGEERSTEYRHYFVAGSEGIIDVTDNGDLSCAWFVSSVLAKHGLLSRARPTVASTIQEIEQRAEWEEIEEHTSFPGAVILWPLSTSGHYHLGFYLGLSETGQGEYVSNSFMEKAPIIHGETLVDGRQPIRAFGAVGLTAYASTCDWRQSTY